MRRHFASLPAIILRFNEAACEQAEELQMRVPVEEITAALQ